MDINGTTKKPDLGYVYDDHMKDMLVTEVRHQLSHR